MIRKTLVLAFLVIAGSHKIQAHTRDTCKSLIYIIGTVHSATPYRNADSLLLILKDLRPDLILCETDTLSGYFKPGYQLVEPPGLYRFARKLNIGRKMPPEFEVIYTYRKLDPTVKLYPYDIAIPDRKNSAQEEQEWLVALEKANTDGLIPDELIPTYTSYMQLYELYDHIDRLGYRELNRRSLTDSVREHMKMDEALTQKLAKGVPALAAYYDWSTLHFMNWHQRNKVMVQNIIRLTQQTKAQKVVVFTGLLHKYYLIDQLSGASQQDKLQLKEYYSQ